MAFSRTTAINKLGKMKARKKVVQGGTSGGKTYGIIPILINKAAKNSRIKITVVAETIPAAKDGVVSIFKDVMIDTNRWVEKRWIGSPMQYTFANGSVIQFKAFDSVGKAKASGKRDVLFLNEANHIPFDIADALMIRSKETWIDFNPDNEFWVHTEILPEHNSEFLLLTYLDNEACPKETIEDLLIKKEKAKTSSYWENWCKVYIDGEIGSLEGVIFSNWKLIDKIPTESRLLGYGLDFGYTNDPTSIVEIYKYNDIRIVNEICYQKGLSNSQIAKFITTKLPCYCDSAEPKSIAELKASGVNAIAVKKGTDSINFGIQIMQDQSYNVTSKSINLINELRKYAWDKDKKTGEKTNSPIDNFNHGIDAWRYHEMMNIGIIKERKGWGSSKTV
jgi:phage terminase large subunit